MDGVRRISTDLIRLLQKFKNEGIIVKEDYLELAKEFEKLVL